MKTNIYFIGDLHGSFKPIRDFIQRYPKLSRDHANGEENILICLGDFGANFFFDYRDNNFKKKLGKYPITTYFVIRGNHEQRPSICASENPELWEKEHMFDNVVYVEKNYPYIKYALDIPGYYNINGYRTLIVPGAYSIDKEYRLMKKWGWFENEQLNEDEMRGGRELCAAHDWEFDLILSHTCPISYEPTDLFLSFIDQNTVDKSMERYLGELEHSLKYKVWCWGHYHRHREYPRKLGITTYDNPRHMMLYQLAVKLEDIFYDNTINKL